MVGVQLRKFYMTFSWNHQVALERVKEFTDLPREAPEFIEPRPPASWPSEGGLSRSLSCLSVNNQSLLGSVVCEDLVIRYSVRPLVISVYT